MSKFATVINCMDGRTQKAIQEYIMNSQGIEFVDTITEAGPCKIICDNKNHLIIDNIKDRLEISINVHQSRYIAVSGHHDCAAVKDDDEKHKDYIIESAMIVSKWYPDIKVEAIWINSEFKVEVIKKFY